MLRANSETAVATLTEANLERPMRTASDHASRRAVAMSFSCSMGIFLGGIGSGAAGPAAPARLPAVVPGVSARAQEAISWVLLLRAKGRTEFSHPRMMVPR